VLRRLGLIRGSNAPQTSRKMTGALPVMRSNPTGRLHSLALASTATGKVQTMTGILHPVRKTS
jgi:hypothetical protein